MSSQAQLEPRSLRRILVVKLADMGDVLLATPAIAALRETFPLAGIDALVTPIGAQVLAMNPHVDRCVPLAKSAFDTPSGLLNPAGAWSLTRLAVWLRRQRYDAAVLLHHLVTGFGAAKFRALCLATGAPIVVGLENGRGGFLTHRAVDLGFGAKSELEYGLDVAQALGARATTTRPIIRIPTPAQETARGILASQRVQAPYIVIHPSVGGYSPARSWHPAKFGEVAKALQANLGLPLVLVGSDDASGPAQIIAEQADVADLTGRTTITELAAILDRAVLVIGADSGVAHLANALRTPTLTIFGPSNHLAWGPQAFEEVGPEAGLPTTSDQVVVRAGIPCSPCFYTGYTLGRRNGCQLRTCLDLVSAGRVAQIAMEIVHRNSPHN